MELLPEKYGQAAQMTVCEGPETNAEECGHWYSPAAVARTIAAEREACATAIRAAALECDDEAEAHGMRVAAGILDKRSNARANSAGACASPGSEATES